MRTRLWLAPVLIIIGNLVVLADSPTRPEPEWARLERELREKGVASEVESVIVAARTHHDLEVRWKALELLGRRGDREAATALRRIMQDDEERLIRETAALALARLGHREVFADLRGFLMTSVDASRQVFLATELAAMGDFYGYRFVAKASRSPEEHMRLLGARALMAFLIHGSFPVEEELRPQDLLIKLLRDRSARVRKEAVFQVSLGAARGLAVGPYLEVVTEIARDDPDAGVREAARLALVSLERIVGANGPDESRRK